MMRFWTPETRERAGLPVPTPDARGVLHWRARVERAWCWQCPSK